MLRHDSRMPAGESGICGLHGPGDWRQRMGGAVSHPCGTDVANTQMLGIAGSQLETGRRRDMYFEPGGVSFRD
jgi:hypothetical protein